MNVITPSPITSPPPEQDLFVVRGDVLEVVLGFTGEPEVVANPAAYRQRLVIRRRQADTLPDLVSVQGTFDIDPGDRLNGVPIDLITTFNLTTAQTASIPVQGAYFFIEWTDPAGGSNRRILQGRVRVGD
jgi:hypothetical protein